MDDEAARPLQTDRELAEDALRASEARKGAMLEAAIDAVIAMDDTGRITEFSPAAERTFGHRREDVIGKELAEIIVPPDLRERHRAGLIRYLATGDAAILGRRIELRAVRADGQQIPVEVAINRIDQPGPPTFIGYVRDISGQRRLEESLRQAQKMDAIGQLAGGVAHDFNNMLTVIDGFSTLLLDELDPTDERRELVDEIQRATARAASLTAQLLSVSRRQALRLQPFDLNKLVSDLQPQLGRVVADDVVVVVHTAEEPVVVDIDDAHFEQVILNLAVNARDAMPAGGSLTIETGVVELDADYAEIQPGVTPGLYAILVVSDTGIGMDAVTQARMYEPFFTTKDVGKGTGLGLAMVYGTVQQSGGHIGVEFGAGLRHHVPDLPASERCGTGREHRHPRHDAATAWSRSDRPRRRGRGSGPRAHGPRAAERGLHGHRRLERPRGTVLGRSADSPGPRGRRRGHAGRPRSGGRPPSATDPTTPAGAVCLGVRAAVRDVRFELAGRRAPLPSKALHP